MDMRISPEIDAEMQTDEEYAELLQEEPEFLPSVERLRIMLMFFMCIELFGFPTRFGKLVQILCGFVPIAFFILSGYLVLWAGKDRPQRILRAIRRAAIAFAVLTVVYFFVNYFLYGAVGLKILPLLGQRRFWFDFIVLGVWQFDIGGAIWYVEALLFAYIIIYIIDRLQLLRFDWIIAAVLIALTVCTGELAGVLPWEFLGYNYIPANFLTRALPYILLGGFIGRHMDIFGSVQRLWYFFAIALGFGLMLGEIVLLSVLDVPGYYGHLIGMPVVAASVCILAFQDDFPEPGFEAIFGSRWHINCIYYLCYPVSILVAAGMTLLSEKMVSILLGFAAFFVFIICACLAWILARITDFLIGKSGLAEDIEGEEGSTDE